MKASAGGLVLAVATAVVVASIVAAVALVGGPASGRLERLDDRRVEDLRGIVQAIDRLWNDHGRLPASLEELAQDPRARVEYLDPGSGAPYEYRTLEGHAYELCAVFDQASRASGRTPTDFWAHGVGRHCFQLEARPPQETAGAPTRRPTIPLAGSDSA